MKSNEILKEIKKIVNENVKSEQTHVAPYNTNCIWYDINYEVKKEENK